MNEAQRFLLDLKNLMENRQAQAQDYFDAGLGDWGSNSIRLVFPDGSTAELHELTELLDKLPQMLGQ